MFNNVHIQFKQTNFNLSPVHIHIKHVLLNLYAVLPYRIKQSLRVARIKERSTELKAKL